MATGITAPEISTLVVENSKQAVLLLLLLLLPLRAVDDIAGIALMAGAASSTARRGSLRSGVKPSAWVDSSAAKVSVKRILRAAVAASSVRTGGVFRGGLLATLVAD
tara:strand:- start:39 stop:359 length:321 start_codon:yes stop_codon:yes gene_type:complete